jgi:hypothetical protein
VDVLPAVGSVTDRPDRCGAVVGARALGPRGLEAHPAIRVLDWMDEWKKAKGATAMLPPLSLFSFPLYKKKASLDADC